MKKIMAVILAFSLLTINALADVFPTGNSIITDKTVTMFTSPEDAVFDGWVGSSKTSDSSIDSKKWFTFYSASRCIGNVLSNYPEDYTGSNSPSGTILYNATNFGSEYEFTGSVYIFQNQVSIYLNTAASISSSNVSILSGYRIYLDRTNKMIKLQKCVNSNWSDLTSVSTASVPYSPLNYNIGFADGYLTFAISDSAAYSYSFEYDLSADEHYQDAGYLGFGSTSTRMLANNITVKYNSAKVYVKPDITDSSDVFKGFTVYAQGSAINVFADLQYRYLSDIKKVELYIDNVIYDVLTCEGNRASKTISVLEKGMHFININLTDKYGSVSTICEGRFLVSDFYASACTFTNSSDEVISSISQAQGQPVTASFKFNQPSQKLSALSAMIIQYDADGKMVELKCNKLSEIGVNTETQISVSTEAATQQGWSIAAFLCEDFANSAPVSGSFELN